ALGSMVWVVAILGILVPTVGDLLISSVPRTPVSQVSWLRLAMLGLAAFLPGGKRSGTTIVGQAVRGYPYTVGFTTTILFLGVWGLVRRIHALRHKWE